MAATLAVMYVAFMEASMLERKTLYVLDYYKKNTFLGSDGPLNFRIYGIKDEDGKVTSLQVVSWEGPFIFDKTPNEDKKYKDFPYSEEGMEEIIKYLDSEKNLLT